MDREKGREIKRKKDKEKLSKTCLVGEKEKRERKREKESEIK